MTTETAIDPAAVPAFTLAGGAKIPAIGLGTFGSDRFSLEDIAAATGECGIVTTMINAFRAAHPETRVSQNVVAWPGYSQLTSQIAARQPPDLVTMHGGVISDYAAKGLLEGIVGAGKLQAEAFRGFTLHIVLETLPNQPRAYTAEDTPVYADKRGPYCGRLPNPPWSQSNPVTQQPDFADGNDSPTGKGISRVGPGWSGRSAGYAGGRDEASLLKALLGPGLGVSADDVPDLGVLLVGPMARGAEVSLR